MPSLKSYLQALSSNNNTEEKAIRNLPHWVNQIQMSPKSQGDLSGLIIPKATADKNKESINLEYLHRMYDCHDLVWSCINLVSRTFAQARLRVKKLKDGKWVYTPDHPMQKVLDAPNSSMTGFDLRQSFVVHRLLFGTVAFILLRGYMFTDDNEVNKCPKCLRDHSKECAHILWTFNKGPITQIMPVHLDRLDKEAFKMADGTTKSIFMYSINGKDKMPVHPDNILTDPNYDTDSSFYGTSPTEKIIRWLELDLGLTKQMGAYLVNSAIPSFMINFKPSKDIDYGDPKTMMDKIKEDWMQKFSFNGSNNYSNNQPKSPTFFLGDMDVHKIQDSLKDIVVKPLFYEITSRVSMVYNIPKGFFEFGVDYSSQAATSVQQRIDFFNDAIQPELITFKEKMERHLLPSYPDNEDLALEWDLSNMGVAQFLEDAHEKSVLRMWEMGMITLDEAREMLQLDPYHNSQEGLQRYRTSIMSDGSGNTINQSIDNRLQPDPRTGLHDNLI